MPKKNKVNSLESSKSDRGRVNESLTRSDRRFTVIPPLASGFSSCLAPDSSTKTTTSTSILGFVLTEPNANPTLFANDAFPRPPPPISDLNDKRVHPLSYFLAFASATNCWSNIDVGLNVCYELVGLTMLAAAASASILCTQSFCGNAKLSTLGNIQSDPFQQFPSTPTVEARTTWSSLFKSLPRNVGSFSPRTFGIIVIDGVNIPPTELIQEGVNHLSEFLVGFFLEFSTPYMEVREQCKRVWNLKDMKDKLRALETSPLIIEGKSFIVTPWILLWIKLGSRFCLFLFGPPLLMLCLPCRLC